MQWVGSPPASMLPLGDDEAARWGGGTSPASAPTAGSAGAAGSSPLGSVGDSATRKVIIRERNIKKIEDKRV